MALKDLKSDLSWYGKKAPGPYKPNVDVNDTKFKGVDNVPYVEVSGYEAQGTAVTSPVAKYAGDSFIIDNVSFSDRGAASRKAQLGNGTKFIIGPEGQVHTFDEVRIGFNSTARYGDVYSNL